MTIVYLDQCAVGCLAERKPSQWEEVSSILETGFKEQQIVCPFPTETLFETAPIQDCALRMEIEAFFSKVSGGYRFRDFGELIIDNSIALIRTDFEVESLENIGFHGWADRDDLVSSLAQYRDNGRERLSETISQHRYPPEAKSMSFDEIFRSAEEDRSDMMWSDLGRFLKGARSKDEFELPWLFGGLVQHRMTDCEAELLREAVQNGKWIKIMENKLELLLLCLWHHDKIQGRRKNHDPNDEIDRWRAVVGLSPAQLFVTDRSAADLCRRVASLVSLPARIIAVNQPEEIISFLQLDQ